MNVLESYSRALELGPLPVEDCVADADEGDDDVLAEEAGHVRRDLLPEVREEVRDLKWFAEF